MRSLKMSVHNLIPFTRYAYAGERMTCNLCGSAETVSICRNDRRLKRLHTVACKECGLMRTDPMPTEAELSAYYASEYRRDYQWAFSTRPPRFHVNRSRREAQARRAMLAPVLKPQAQVLDFGSGSGEFLDLMRSEGHSAVGIEPGESFAAHARHAYGAEVICKPWQDVALPAGRFDVITAHHVLEHLREPVRAMARLADWLADDGALYIAVPDGEARREKTFQHFHFAHVHTFTRATLIRAGAAVGLAVDPRVVSDGTALVFCKQGAMAEGESWASGQGQHVAARFTQDSPLHFLMSGRWLIDALRRAHKTVRDSRS
jgi:2-polyprenyl-3-methyl-5-hydroxy-6-metoxy-1,4-benzoquinol methylase